MVDIVNDGVDEGSDEKFKLFLENASNAVIGQVDKTQIHLVDFEDGQSNTRTHARTHASVYISVILA